jgi:hypothetical protein
LLFLQSGGSVGSTVVAAVVVAMYVVVGSAVVGEKVYGVINIKVDFLLRLIP